MKILEVIPFLSQGGGQRFVVDLCNELIENNDITLVVLMPLDKYGDYLPELSNKVKVVSLNKKLGKDLTLFKRMADVVKAESPDIVHTHLRAIYYLSLSIMTNRKPIYIHTVHNDAFIESGERIGLIMRKLFFKYKLVIPITISSSSQQSFKECYHMDSKLIENGRPLYTPNVDLIKKAKDELNKKRIHKDSTIILNVARISKQKNQIALAEAIKLINAKNEKKVEAFILGIVSDNDYSKALDGYITPEFHCLGMRENPRDYMAASDAFCLSSIFEGMPITLIECFSVGKIPICNPVGGTVDMIKDNKNGLLTEGTTSKDIQNCLQRFLSMSQKEKEEMEKESKQSFGRYSMSVCADKYSAFMNQLIIEK